MKKLKIYAAIYIMVIFIFTILISCYGKSPDVVSSRSNENNLNGRWVSENYAENWIEFSGKDFTYGSYPFGYGSTWLSDRYQRDATNGKYSISDNNIEMVFSDGKIKVYNFSRTENTISIDGNRLIISK